jgi:hypothetical protein
MELRTLVNIQNLAFDTEFRCRLGDITLTNQYSVREEFYTPDFIQRFGTFGVEKKKELVFAKSWFKPESVSAETPSASEAIFLDIQQVSSFMTFLWLVKDNAAYVTGSHSIYTNPGIEYISMSAGSHVWDRNGKGETVSFSEDEISDAVQVALKYRTLMTKKASTFSDYGLGKDVKTAVFGISPTYKHNENSSLDRALIFLQSARASSHLPYRIALYMPILECLLSHDAQEVSHKVCERAAFYLRDSASDRKCLYRDLRTGYAIRSKYLHGATFEKKHLNNGEPERLAMLLDDVVREILRKAILHDSELFIEKTGTNEEARKRDLDDIIFR